MYLDELNIFFGEANKSLFHAKTYLQKGIKLSPMKRFSEWLFKDDIRTLEKQLDIIIKKGRLKSSSDASDYSIAKCEESLEKSLDTPKGKDVFRMLMRHILRKDDFISKAVCETAFRNKKIIDSTLVWVNQESIKSLGSKLLSFNDKSSKELYANVLAQELDAKLCVAFEQIIELENSGYEGIYIRRDINDYIRDLIALFANFNIDLVKYLEKHNDFDPEFGSYEKFRHTKFTRELNNQTPIVQPSIEDSSFVYDNEKMLVIYNLCNSDVFNVSFKDFIAAVDSADFSSIFGKADTKKSKMMFSISVMKNFVHSIDWYKKAAESIGSTPAKCSGANVKRWADKINSAIE